MAFYDSGVTYDSGILYDEVVSANPRKRMSKTKLNLREKSDSDLLNYARQHIAAMTGNANFATPSPTAAVFLTTTDAYETALLDSNAAQQSARQKTTIKDTARTTLEASLSQRGGYVDSASGGDEQKILSSGLGVRGKAEAIGAMPAPIDFLATQGDHEGEIDLTWSRVRGAKSYMVQQSANVTPRVWQQAMVSPRSSATVKGLTSGQVYAFRVAAVGAAGDGPWSDESTKMAP